MSDSPRIIYRLRSDIIREEAQAARIAALRFALDCHARKRTTRPGAPDARKEPDGSGTPSIPE